jgi:enterochelin esterase-like enzyme
MVDQYVPQLKQYHAFALEVGLQDTLLRTNQDLDALLTQQGVPHSYETYEGDHTNHVPERIEQRVLPFFSKNLAFK